ncbi:MAG: membrane protein insertase YidC [Lentisphaeria bacterium]|nr:membrane protein insertase YidC [Lentisphaeria bacterium]
MDKTSTIVITICVILLFFTWQTPQQAPQPVTAVPTTQVQEATPVQKEKVKAVATIKPTTDFKNVTLANDKISVVINPNVGGVTNVDLTAYMAEEDKTKGYSFPMTNGPLLKLKSKTGYALQITGSKQTGNQLVITGKVDGLSVNFTQTFALSDKKTDAEQYILNSKVTFQNTSDKPVAIGDLFVGIGSITPLIPGSSSYIYGGETNQRLVWRDHQNEDVDYENAKSISDTDGNVFHKGELLDWVGLENRYFTTILNSSTRLQAANASTFSLGDDKGNGLIGYAQMQMTLLQGGQSQSFDFNAYVGPKKYDLLLALGQDQEDMLDLGMVGIRSLSKIVLNMLIWLGTMGLNYGLVVIIITVIIKGLFWPITHKSSVSMKRMSSIQPLIKELREKHKGNQQLIQQKTMEIYKEHKVNPIGGCLPMFIQIPVFFALYSTFRSAVELRHNSFLWCSDLARPDTVGTLFSIAINPLAILMVVTMFAQQILAPTSADPNQKKMMLAMPFIMLFFMYDMPAGLTLYWTVSQLLSIVQQHFTNKSIKIDTK